MTSATLKIRGGVRTRLLRQESRKGCADSMGVERDSGGEPRPDTICVDGNGYRPSHFGDGWTESDVMYTLNSTEVHAVCYGICSYGSNSMRSSNPYSCITATRSGPAVLVKGREPAPTLRQNTGDNQVSVWNGKADGATGNGVAFSITGDHDNRPTDMTNIIICRERQDIR